MRPVLVAGPVALRFLPRLPKLLTSRRRQRADSSGSFPSHFLALKTVTLVSY